MSPKRVPTRPESPIEASVCYDRGEEFYQSAFLSRSRNS